MQYNLAYLAIFLVWLVGITFATSYGELLPLWMTLGWMTVWPAICRPQTEAEANRAASSIASGARRESKPKVRPSMSVPADWKPSGWREPKSREPAQTVPDWAKRWSRE